LEIVDIEGLSAGGASALARVSREIGHACRDTGFFYVRNHGVPADLISAMLGCSAAFFSQPRAEKDALAISRSRHNRGYVGVGAESLNGTEADLKEAFNIGLDLSESDPEVIAGKPFRGVNSWPLVPGFRDTTLSYFNAVWQLGLDLHRAIAVDLGLPPDYFAGKFDHPMATLRLLHYPPRTASVGAVRPGAGEHTDYGSLTLLLTDEAGGLEVRRRDKSWIAAPFVPGTFVCNIGDCLMRWSNDIYVSTPHRVMNPPGRDRFSIAFFLDPNPDAMIACLPGCDGPALRAKYAPILASDYLAQRLGATYA
jgi:isopenicillin N synthase-like dioxygenase